MRDLDTAQHEAAHLVVGVSLGLSLRRAVIEPAPQDWQAPGYCWFPRGVRRKRLALATMYAAGIAWENAIGNTEAETDARLCRELVGSLHDVTTCVKFAGALLVTLAPIHTRVTRALLDRDLSGRDVVRIARGERLEREE